MDEDQVHDHDINMANHKVYKGAKAQGINHATIRSKPTGTFLLRYRTLITLWFAMFMSLVMYLVFIHFAAATATANQRLSLVLHLLQPGAGVVIVPAEADNAGQGG